MNLVKRLKEKETNYQPVNDHLSLRLLPDLLGHHLGSLHVAAEHHHLDERRTIESLFKETTLAPLLLMSRAVNLPMPVLQPVIATILPSSLALLVH